MTAPKHTTLLVLFSLTLFLSAFLMFGLQPMVGKMLLPLVGGTPAGWIVAMAFFQLMLLAGYFMAHAFARFTPRVHTALFVLALIIGAACLPPVLPPLLPDTTAPDAFDIFHLLTMTVALPFVAISAASSTLQRLFTTTGHASARDPYFLYAASNIGSLAGLLAYPTLVETFLPLSLQSRIWMAGYALLIGLGAACLLLSRRTQQNDDPAATEDLSPRGPKAGWRRQLHWVLLAFIPSSLMLGVTTHITTDVFSAPLMWVLPLSLYLVTFIIAFSRQKTLTFDRVTTLQPVVVATTIGAMFLCRTSYISQAWPSVFLHLLAFFAVALMCHLYLARLRPVDQPQQLTSFYLMLSIGGALGGAVNAFIVPALLDRIIEYPVLLILSLLVNPAFYTTRLSVPIRAMIVLVLVFIVAIGIIDTQVPVQDDRMLAMALVTTGIIVLATVFLSMNIRAAFFGALVMFLVTQFVIPQNIIYQARNFYGYIRIADNPIRIGKREALERVVRHGSTKHGSQILDPAYKTEKTTYYTNNSPPAEFIGMFAPKDIAVVGLGAGTLNCFSTPENAFTFIDIDRDMAEAAQKYFTYLSDCKGRRPPRIVVGDGRLELAKMKDEKFDLIILDAFSSDAIPVHLLTTDAIRSYLDRLSPKGMLAFHISNRYFNLIPILGRNAEATGLHAMAKLRIPTAHTLETPSLWVVMARPELNMEVMGMMSWRDIKPQTIRPWTDDFNNLIGALMIFNAPQDNYAETPKP